MNLKTNHGKGNVERQRQKRRQRRKNLPARQSQAHQLIDNNWTHYPCAYCERHGGWLTQGLIETHRCEQRHCKCLNKTYLNERGTNTP